MDPVTALLAGYLATVTEPFAAELFSHMDLAGTEKTAEVHGLHVSFTHQTWKIKDRSVCKSYRGDVVQRSRCTLAAKELFIQTCGRLRKKRLYHADYASLKNMYCTAAKRYQPIQASVEWAGPTSTSPDASAIQACRLAKAILITEKTAENRHRKKLACDKVKNPK